MHIEGSCKIMISYDHPTVPCALNNDIFFCDVRLQKALMMFDTSGCCFS